MGNNSSINILTGNKIYAIYKGKINGYLIESVKKDWKINENGDRGKGLLNN